MSVSALNNIEKCFGRVRAGWAKRLFIRALTQRYAPALSRGERVSPGGEPDALFLD